MRSATVTRLKTKAPTAVNFTDAAVKALPARADRYEMRDTGNRYLRVRVAPTGAKSFRVVIRSRVTGKLEAITVGPVSAWSVKQARDEAARLAVAVTAHKDVATERRAARAVVKATATTTRETVEELLQAYIEGKRLRKRGPDTKQLSPATAGLYARQLRLLLGDAYTQPFRALNPEAVVTLHEARRTKAPHVAANGRRMTVGSPYGADTAVHALAAIAKFHELPSPCINVYKENRISEIVAKPTRLDVDDAPALAAWLRAAVEAHKGAETPITQSHEIMLLAMTTGLRRKTMLELTWGMLTLSGTKPRMDLPAQIMKSKRDAILPIPPKTAEWLRARFKRAPIKDGYVFPQVTDPTKICKPSASWVYHLPFPCGFHDGRKMFGDTLDRFDNVKESQIMYLLHHTASNVTQKHYTPQTVEKTRAASAMAEAAILSKLGNAAIIKEYEARARANFAEWQMQATIHKNKWRKAGGKVATRTPAAKKKTAAK